MWGSLQNERYLHKDAVASPRVWFLDVAAVEHFFLRICMHKTDFFKILFPPHVSLLSQILLHLDHFSASFFFFFILLGLSSFLSLFPKLYPPFIFFLFLVTILFTHIIQFQHSSTIFLFPLSFSHPHLNLSFQTSCHLFPSVYQLTLSPEPSPCLLRSRPRTRVVPGSCRVISVPSVQL